MLSAGAWGWLPGLLGSAALAAVLQQLEREASGRPQQSRRQQPQPQQDGDSIKKPMQTADLPTGMDSIETDEAVWYFVDLPGLDKKEIQVLPARLAWEQHVCGWLLTLRSVRSRSRQAQSVLSPVL